MPATTIEIHVSGETRVVTVEPVGSAPGRYRVSWGGVTRVVDVQSLDPDSQSLLLTEGGSGSYQVRCEETNQPGGVDVHVDGIVVPLRVDDGRLRLKGRGARDSMGPGGQHVVALMPGKVVRILVQPGDEIAARQSVAVVEAMKMENELTAPRAGRVAEVSVEEGDSVETGRVLVVIE